METNVIKPLPPKKNRIKGNRYLYNNKVVIWSGNRLYCQHNKDKVYCKICDGSAICPHDKRKNICYKCNGSQICIHKKKKSQCIECKGGNICVHNKQKAHCKICLGTKFL